MIDGTQTRRIESAWSVLRRTLRGLVAWFVARRALENGFCLVCGKRPRIAIGEETEYCSPQCAEAHAWHQAIA